MSWILQLVSFAYNVEHGIIPAAIPDLRARFRTSPFEESLLQCICVLGIQLGIFTMWKFQFRQAYLVVALVTLCLANVATGFCIRLSPPNCKIRVLLLIYSIRFIGGLASAYPIQSIPKWINQTTPAGKTIGRQANFQLTGVLGTVAGYIIVLCAPLVAEDAVSSAFVIAGGICLIALIAVSSASFEEQDLDSSYKSIDSMALLDRNTSLPTSDRLIELGEPWYDLSSLMTTPVASAYRKKAGNVIMNNLEFFCVTCAVGINSSACQALAFWILTVYVSCMQVTESKALLGITLVFGVGTVLGLAVTGRVIRLDEQQKSGKQILQRRLMWMSIFTFFTGSAGIYGYFYGHHGFWNFTIAMTISVMFGAASTPLAQSAVGNCAKNFEDIAYGIYQTVFQSSWFFGPLLPVAIAKVLGSEAEVAGIKGVMGIPILAFLCTLFAYCDCCWRGSEVDVTEDQIELSWDRVTAS